MIADDLSAEERRRLQERRRNPQGMPAGLLLLVAVAVSALVGQRLFLLFVGDRPAMQMWSTVFVAIVLQAVPFLGLGVVLSGIIAAFVPDRAFDRALPRNAALAVPIAGAAGAVLPGCECASVPFAGRLVARGVAPSAALAFMLSSPAINPVVLVATAVAFPQQPWMVLARFLASLGTAVTVGWVWARFGRATWLQAPRRIRAPGGSRWATFGLTLQHDFLHAGGFLVVGAAFAATFNVTINPDWTLAVAGVPVLSVLVLATLAVVLVLQRQLFVA